MREIDVLLPLAKSHDDVAMMELAFRFVHKMLRECKRFHHENDEDMQAYLLLRFIEAVYAYKLNAFAPKRRKK